MRPLPPARECTFEQRAPGHRRALATALSNRRIVALGVGGAAVYLLLFGYFGGMITHVHGSQFVGVTSFPHAATLWDAAEMLPQLEFQPAPTWYLQIDALQAAELFVVAILVIVNIAFSGLLLKTRNRNGAGLSSAVGVAPIVASNGAVVACCGIPVGIAALPTPLASVAGGFLSIADFYGIGELLTIVVLAAEVFYQWKRASSLPIATGNAAIHYPTRSVEPGSRASEC